LSIKNNGGKAAVLVLMVFPVVSSWFEFPFLHLGRIYFASVEGIVMSMSVCLSVCLFASISSEPQARSLPFFVHIAYRHGSILLRQGDKIQRGSSSFGGFSIPLTRHCTA